MFKTLILAVLLGGTVTIEQENRTQEIVTRVEADKVTNQRRERLLVNALELARKFRESTGASVELHMILWNTAPTSVSDSAVVLWKVTKEENEVFVALVFNWDVEWTVHPADFAGIQVPNKP